MLSAGRPSHALPLMVTLRGNCARDIEAEGRRTEGRRGCRADRVADHIVVARVAQDLGVPDVLDGDGGIEFDGPAIQGRGVIHHGHLADEAAEPAIGDPEIHRIA